MPAAAPARTTLSRLLIAALLTAACTSQTNHASADPPPDAASAPGVVNQPALAVPAATFDDAYQAAYRDSVRFQVPEVYELVNIALALTPAARSDSGLVARHTPYHARMTEWFGERSGHPVVQMLDSALIAQHMSYFSIKMNGYAFQFDNHGRIVKRPQFDRTGFPRETSNTLEPFVGLLEDFARTTSFREFYKTNQPTYERQIAFYRDSADVPAMISWLRRNFPRQQPYDTYNVVFSPLVGWNQSVSWFSSNGFTELQPHVNFPYPADPPRPSLRDLSPEAALLRRGTILFTEINHGFINPEASRYGGRITNATSNRSFWLEERMERYYPGAAAFTEYMNWALVALRMVDVAPPADRDRLVADVDTTMLRRGFPQFPALTQFLVPLYRDRAEGRTLADLYPEIIDWFEAANR